MEKVGKKTTFMLKTGYVCFVYGAVSKQHLKKTDIVINKAQRLCASKVKQNIN